MSSETSCYDPSEIIGAETKVIKVKGRYFGKMKVVQVVSEPKENSKLAKLKLQKSDQIQRVNGKRIRSVNDLVKAFSKTNRKMEVQYTRDGQNFLSTANIGE